MVYLVMFDWWKMRSRHLSSPATMFLCVLVILAEIRVLNGLCDVARLLGF